MMHTEIGKKRMFVAIVPVLNQHDVTEQVMESWFRLAKSCVRIVFIDNGSNEPLVDQEFIRRWSSEHDIRVVRNDENVGVYPTFQQGLNLVGDTRFIFYSHNDVEMIELGWDEKMSKILGRLSGRKVGVCGMFGARGIGTPDIYKSSYHFSQMMRWDCITVASMSGAGGREIQRDYERVVVLDGFSLILSVRMIAKAMKFEFDHERYPPHHMYDQDICLTSHHGGFENYVIDVDCKHHGGVTSTREKWAEKMGTTDLKIHRHAHRVFYDKWRGRLPVSV